MDRTFLNDDKILRAIKGSEKEENEAIKSLFNNAQLKKQVKSYVLSVGGNKLEAEEIFIDGIFIFWKNVKTDGFRGGSKISTYIFGICKNQFLKIKKNKKTMPGELKENMAQLEFSKMEEIIAEEYGKEMVASVRQWMANMSKICKKVLELYYWNKYKLKEVAEEMKYGNEQTAKNTIHRCREQFRNIIKKDTRAVEKIKSFGYGKL